MTKFDKDQWVIEVLTRTFTGEGHDYWSPLVTFHRGTSMEHILERIRNLVHLRREGYQRARELAKRKGTPIDECEIFRLRNTDTGDIIMGDVL